MGPPIRSRIGFRATPALQELRLRTPLVGDFDLVLEWEDSMRAPDGITQSSPDFNVSPYLAFLQMAVQKLDGTAACYASRAYQCDPLVYPGTADNNHYRGKYDDDGTIYHPLTTDTVGKFRIKRDGSNLNVYYWNAAGPAWVRLGPGRTTYNTDPLQLVLTGLCDHGCMNYTLLSLTHNDEEPTLFAAAGTYESSLFDAGQTVQWERISWAENLESGTDVKFQVAFSNDAAGPWSYIGPDGTSGTTFTTPAGEDFDATSDFEGRYARFKVTLTGDGTETPSFGGVHLSFSGEGLLDSSVQNYQYDEAGNITMVTTVTDAGTAVDDRNPVANPINELNQIVQQDVGGDSWIYSYDDNGNMTGKTNGIDAWTYSWSDENRLVRVQGPGSVDVAYSYDSMGRMLTRDDGTLTTLVWDGWDVIREVTGESETTYLAPEGQILSFIRDGVTYQAHSDALGSIRMITDEEGEVVARYEYGAFGEAISVTEDPALAGFPMRFIGSLGVRLDGLSGLLCMRQRWYDSGLERFISRDPIGRLEKNGSYCYAYNNPLNNSDPSGLSPTITINVAAGTRTLNRADYAALGADLAASLGLDADVKFNFGSAGEVGWNKAHDQLTLEMSFKPSNRKSTFGLTPEGGRKFEIYENVMRNWLKDQKYCPDGIDKDAALKTWIRNTIKHELGHALTGLPDDASSILRGTRGYTDRKDGSVMDSSTVKDSHDAILSDLDYSPSMKSAIWKALGMPTQNIEPIKYP